MEVVAQGEEDKLLELITVCEKGPMMSEVKSVAVEWQEPEVEIENFEKKPTG